MFRKKETRPNSPYPLSLPGGDSESFEDFLNRVQKDFDDGDEDAFWAAVDSAPARWQRKPEFLLVKAGLV